MIINKDTGVLERYFLEQIFPPNRKRVLREEIYRRVETSYIDNEFKIILNWFKNPENLNSVKSKKVDPNVKFKVQINNIAKYIKNLFNCNIVMEFDKHTKFNRISFGMAITIDRTELSKKVGDAIEKHKSGFYIYQLQTSKVYIDYGMIGLAVERGLNEKHLTAVLFHELGHRVYIQTQYDIDAGKKEFPIAIRDKSSVDKVTSTQAISTLVVWIDGFIIYKIAKSIDENGSNKKKLIGLITSAIVFILSSILSMFTTNLYYTMYDNSQYVAGESLSDLVAVKYGYGGEIAKVMDIFYAITKARNANKLSLLRLFKLNRNDLNTSRMRRDNIKTALEKELADNNNSKKEKDEIKNILAQIEEMEKLNEEYSFLTEEEDVIFKDFSDNCIDVLMEQLTFRSADLKKIEDMYASSKVLNKIASYGKKGYKVVHSLEELNPLNIQIIMNKIREMAEVSVTNTAGGGVSVSGDNIGVGGGVATSKTHLELKNVVVMPVNNLLSIVEGNDKGRIISATLILVDPRHQIKFIKIQSAIFKF